MRIMPPSAWRKEAKFFWMDLLNANANIINTNSCVPWKINLISSFTLSRNTVRKNFVTMLALSEVTIAIHGHKQVSNQTDGSTNSNIKLTTDFFSHYYFVRFMQFCDKHI